MIRTCLFDLGNVLLFFSHEKMCRQIGTLCGLSVAEVQELLFDSGLQRRFERGELSAEEFHRDFQAVVGQQLDYDQLALAGSDIFQLNAPMLPILDQLKAQGCRLLVLSNTTAPHVEFIRRQYDLLERFDEFVFSYEAGAVKPEDAIYAKAVEKADCSPTECFYTDDIADFVARGRTFGFQAEMFVGVEALIAQLRQRGIAVDSAPTSTG